MAPRTWFITGASSGFVAKKALENGDKCVATLRKPEAIADFAAKYTKEQLLVVKLDVTKREEVVAAFTVAKKAFGRIDIVFNNAGVGALGEIEGTSEELARSLFEVNFWGAVNVTKQAVSFFREENKPPGGLLINMSSMYGIDAPPLAGFYGATKFAFSGLANLSEESRFRAGSRPETVYRILILRSVQPHSSVAPPLASFFDPFMEAVTDPLAKELDPAWNIKVVLVCPGFFKTEMGQRAICADVHPAYANNEALASVQLRKILSGVLEGNSPLLGDPEKLINKFYELSKLENPPYRVAFGEDALAGFQSKWTALKSAWEVSEEWSKDLKFASNWS
ncbi:NAD(P)-binding protein [Mycena latifolia]|nr:NAD(P)-binding protein [Mycena latifolia]